ncbi:helix-turn-helix domain-containing protein [Paenibacillus sp. LHD-117]|uniref:PucR family transcriptional regulator n=1 Tax=Paenibacillus sp. LHD-117 TaxID=3071412 RepID=UPI0027DF5D30|nr:helix-turn-helix domain-containing protein [Paenibacillus sp. LHD-117]MDQ6422777.1 helix-turn-helix domain-containing protein [Paenibacillus sp. LHD-117]
MSKTDWLMPLQHILNSPIQVSTRTVQEWDNFAKDSDAVWQAEPNGGLASGARAEKANTTWFIAGKQEQELSILEVKDASLTPKEKDLISWTLKMTAGISPTKQGAGLSDSERFALKLSEWLQQQLESDAPAYSLPDHLTVGSRLYYDMIPFLLITEQTSASKAAYTELEKLLKSFLSDDILLIPLKSQEWLIWGPMVLLKDEDAEPYESSEEESLEESLTSIASGLHEMLASEWLGECHLAVALPVTPSKGIVETTILLRETINLGRKFHVGTNIHLPWMLQLERLLNTIPEGYRAKYLEQSLKRADLFVEPEMLATLETFFSLDCNVSETAKKLYIHRNTLLYRLDKLKQETGLDVRQFRDAVLVKIILLLYKVTKRN